jgi:ParB-like chromosome segregation protein Spo0J
METVRLHPRSPVLRDRRAVSGCPLEAGSRAEAFSEVTGGSLGTKEKASALEHHGSTNHPRIGRTYPGPPPEVERLVTTLRKGRKMLTFDNLQYGAIRPMPVDVDDISVQPGPYGMSFGYDDTALIRSLEKVGVLNPPYLTANSRGGFDVVSGYRRIAAARSLGWHKILCRNLSDVKMTTFRLLLLNMHENLSTRSFNEVEKAMVLKRLSSHVSQEELIRDFMPLLGLSPHEPILRTYLLFDGLEEPVKKALAKGTISSEAAKLLLDFEVHSRLAVFECISSLRLSSNYQKQLIEYLLDISEIENHGIPEILSREPLVQILGKERTNNPQKAKSLLAALRAMRNPRLADAEARFQQQVSCIHLPPGARITHPPCFEAPGFTLEICFKDGRTLKESISQISGLKGIENVQSPWLKQNGV